MIPRLINQPLCNGLVTDMAKAVDDTVLALPIPQQLPGAVGVRVLNRVTSHGLYRMPNLMQAGITSKAKVLENFELVKHGLTPSYGSSGSDHDPSSVSLFAMVHEFIENEGTGAEQNCASDAHGCNDTNIDQPKADGTEDMSQAFQSLVICADGTEESLLRDTQDILESFSADFTHICDDGSPATVMHSCLKRVVMSHLQKRGYNAAICKMKWDHICGIPAGDYEYIDVLISSDASKCPERLLVDIDFQSQFEIARPTDEFTAIWRLLPPVFVGRAERLKRIVDILSDATKQSLRVKGLHLPPWRKSSYMKAKWFSSYKRTSNMSSCRPCKGDHHQANVLGFAVRGGGLDAKYTNALEILYHKTGSNFWTSEEEVTLPLQKEGDQITVTTTDWQPPAVVPRTTASRKQGTTAGLSSLLLPGPEYLCKAVTVQAA